MMTSGRDKRARSEDQDLEGSVRKLIKIGEAQEELNGQRSDAGVGDILAKLEGHQYILTVLAEFSQELHVDPSKPFESEANYFWFYELYIMARALRQGALVELTNHSVKPDVVDQAPQGSEQEEGKAKVIKERLVNRKELADRFNLLDGLVKHLITVRTRRLEATTVRWQRKPRVFRLAERYKMTEKETELLHFLVVLQGAQSDAARSQLLEDDPSRRTVTCQKLVGMSEIDVEEFYDDERLHVKEGTVLTDDDHYGISLRLTNISVRFLLGRTLTSNQKLKVSQTQMEVLLREEGLIEPKHLTGKAATSKGAKEEIEKGSKSSALKTGGRLEKDSSEVGKFSSSSEQDYDEEGTTVKSIINMHRKKRKTASNLAHGQNTADTSGGEVLNTSDHPTATGVDDSLGPYSNDNQLDYLEDRFQVLAFTIRASGARMKDQMKEAGTKQPWDSNSGGSQAGRRELQAKQKVLESKVQKRLKETEAKGLALPRLEIMCRKLGLNSFEQNVIVLLIGKTVSPVVKVLLEGVDTSPVQRMDESITINQVISVFCDTFQAQIEHRVYFYKSAKLVTRGLVKIHRGRWHSDSGDLVDQRVELDRRILDWVVGLDTEINELVEGSDLYQPKVTIDQVVLPAEQKEMLLESVSNFEKFREYRKKNKLEEVISYGSGLVILLCGASGTGKTMTVNAVANHIGKRVLMVDFPSLQGKKKEGMDTDADLRGLFREADMSNALLFFDECEAIFKQREFGGDRLLNALLTEMERHEGIVFLATNRPYDLDEAMHRRINSVFEFRPPDHIQRKEIWKVLTSEKIPLSDDIDWDAVSLKYELSGGFIKNAVVAALLKAIGRDPKDPLVTEADIVAGCSMQMRGSLQMKTFDHRVVPKAGLDSLVLSKETKQKLLELIQFEKARGVVYGQWGFTFGDEKQQKGTTAVFYGPPGIGKSSAAKCVGFEVGKPLKVVNFSQLMLDSDAQTNKAVRAVFDDARLMDAVLVLEGLETFATTTEYEPARNNMLLMHLLDRLASFPGIVILVAGITENAQIHPDLARAVQFSIQFKMPGADLRASLWKAMIPATAPVESLDYRELGNKYELSAASISNAIFRAAAAAAIKKPKDGSERRITQRNLEDAARKEWRKLRGENAEAMDRLFL